MCGPAKVCVWEVGLGKWIEVLHCEDRINSLSPRLQQEQQQEGQEQQQGRPPCPPTAMQRLPRSRLLASVWRQCSGGTHGPQQQAAADAAADAAGSSRPMSSNVLSGVGTQPGGERTAGLAPPHAGHRPPEDRSFLSWLPASQPRRVLTPLSYPLPSFTPPPGLHAPSSPPPTEITTLANGARIISEASPVGAGRGGEHPMRACMRAGLACKGGPHACTQTHGRACLHACVRALTPCRLPIHLCAPSTHPTKGCHTALPTHAPTPAQGPTASLGIYIDSGSIYEKERESGACAGCAGPAGQARVMCAPTDRVC